MSRQNENLFYHRRCAGAPRPRSAEAVALAQAAVEAGVRVLPDPLAILPPHDREATARQAGARVQLRVDAAAVVLLRLAERGEEPLAGDVGAEGAQRVDEHRRRAPPGDGEQ